jgi:putative addiction module killer protein
MKIIRTEEFSEWLKNLKDSVAKARITRHLEKVAKDGLFGNIGPVGDGVSEFKFHFGPGYRVYFIQRGEEVIVVLGGGTKAGQQRDIDDAKSLASSIED